MSANAGQGATRLLRATRAAATRRIRARTNSPRRGGGGGEGSGGVAFTDLHESNYGVLLLPRERNARLCSVLTTGMFHDITRRREVSVVLMSDFNTAHQSIERLKFNLKTLLAQLIGLFRTCMYVCNITIFFNNMNNYFLLYFFKKSSGDICFVDSLYSWFICTYFMLSKPECTYVRIFINRRHNLALDRPFHLASFDIRTRIRVIYCTLIYAPATSPYADLCDLRARE